MAGFIDSLRHQVYGPRSRRQLVFDVIFGAVIPVLCFIFDPAVFRSRDELIPAYLGGFTAFAYTAALLAIAGLVVVLASQRRIATLGGLLFGGATVSSLLGVALLPLSIFGVLLFGLGLLGFTPLLAAFVYARNGLREVAQKSRTPAIVGFVLFFAAATAVQWFTNHAVWAAVEKLPSPDAVRTLRVFRHVFDEDKLVRRHLASHDPSEKQRLERAFRVMAQGDMQLRLAILQD